MMWLFSLLGLARKAATALFALVVRYPLQFAIIVAVGASVWLWQGKQHALTALETQRVQNEALIVSYTAAQREAAIKALAVKAAQEAKFNDLAKDAQHDHETTQAAVADALGDYIGAHRVRTACALDRASGGPASPGEGGNPGVPAEMPGIAELVEISQRDLQAVNEWATIGLTAHNAAIDKIEAGVAVPQVGFGE
jgi:hypothetical protein